MSKDYVVKFRGEDADLEQTVGKVKKYLKGMAGDVQATVIEVEKRFHSLQSALDEAGLSQKEFNSWMETYNMTTDEAADVTNKLTGQTMMYGEAVQEAVKHSRRFKKEWLSILFTGMALGRTFGGIVQAQMELWGISDMLSAMWTVTMIPAMEDLSNVTYPLIGAFMELDEETQSLIGWIIILGAVIGQILPILAMINLVGVGTFGIIAGAIIGLGIVAKGVIDVMKGEWEGLGLIISGVGVALLTFAKIIAAVFGVAVGWWAVLIIAIGAAVYLIIRNLDKIVDFFIWVGSYIVNRFRKDWDLIKMIFWGAYEFIRTIPGRIVDAFRGIGRLIRNAIERILPGWMIDLLKGAGRIIGGVAGTVRDLIPGFQTGGIMPHTGVAMLHKGERIIPRREVQEESREIVISPTFNINASVASDYDVRKLASQLNEHFAEEMRRLLRERGI